MALHLTPKALRLFNELGLMVEETKSTVVYSRQSKSGSRLDVGRFLRDQPYWANQATSKQPKRKRIILNYWQLFTEESLCDAQINVLIENGFPIYVYTKDNKLIELKKLKNLKDIQLLTNEELKTALIAQGEDPDEYFLLGHKEIKKLISHFQFPLEEEHDVYIEEKQISIKDKNKKRMIDLLMSPLGKQFETIEYSYESDDGHYYSFIWKNNFNREELEALFGALAKGDSKAVLSPASRKNLIHIFDNYYRKKDIDGIQIDLSYFENLIDIHVSGSFPKNTAQLKDLKTEHYWKSTSDKTIDEKSSVKSITELILVSEEARSVPKFNGKRFPNLKKLVIKDQHLQEFTAPNRLTELIELEIDLSECGKKFDDTQMLTTILGSLKDLPKLTKLTLRGINSPWFVGFNFNQFAMLTNLQYLEISNCNAFYDSNIKLKNENSSLKRLYLKGFKNLIDMDLNLPKLSSLRVDDAPNLKRVNGTEHSPDLLYLQIVQGNLNLNQMDVPIKKNQQGAPLQVRADHPHILSYKDEKYQDEARSRASLPIYYTENLEEEPPSYASDTFTPPNKKFKVQHIFSESKNPDKHPDVTLYRKQVITDIDVDDSGNLYFKPASADFKTYQPPASQEYKSHDVYHGNMPGPFFPGKEYVLYGLSAQDKLLSIDNSDNLEVEFSPHLGQYKIKVKPDGRSFLALKYTIATDPNYFGSTINKSDSYVSEDSKLPEQLKTKLEECLTKEDPTSCEEFKKFSSNLKQAVTLNDKLNLIAEYCKGFVNKQLSSTTDNQLLDFITAIRERKGSCYHRSRAFLAICKYAGLAIRFNENVCHDFPEVLLNTPAGNRWIGINLGGASAELEYEQSFYESLTPAKPSAPVEEKKAEEDYAKYKEALLPNLKWQQECKSIDQFISGLYKLPKAVLIRTPNRRDAWAWHQAIAAQSPKPPIYIDSVEELKNLFELTQVKDNTSLTIDGPLKQLIRQGNGTIIVNWNQFSANEKAIYKSMMDDPPTLNGLKIPSTVKVIGLLDNYTEVNDVFLSRCEEVRLPQHLSLSQELFPQKPWFVNNPSDIDQKIDSINLYHDSDWYPYLIESLTIDNDKLISKEGVLIQCMKHGMPLVIKNPPMFDENFRLFWHKFTTDGFIIVNGEKIEIRPGFKVYLQDLPAAKPKAPEKVILDAKLADIKGGDLIHINHENFNMLFSTQQIGLDHKIQSSAPGLLEQYKEGDQFVLQDTLSSEQECKLYDFIQQLKNKKPHLPSFHFYQQPKLATTKPFIEDSKNKSCHIVTNDPYFVVEKVRKAVPDENIFYTNKDNNWAALFEEVNLERKEGKIFGHRKEQLLLEKLKQGKTVILCGDLTKEEYAAIKTLFYQPPYLYINGKRETDIRGTLTWISKPQLMYDTNDAPTLGMSIKPDEYGKLLAKELKDDKTELLNKLDKFINQLSILPRSPHYPGLTDMTYQKYKSMLEYADSKTTQQNPIKPVFQYYFKKGTQEYAYFNSLAKYWFSKSQEEHIRLQKLIKLTKDLHTDEDFIKNFWKICNCLSGELLRKLLPDLTLEMHPPNVIPLPSKVQQKVMIDYIKKMIEPNQRVVQESKAIIKEAGTKRFEKQQQRLAEALKDSDKRFIFLLGPAGTGKTYTVRNTIPKDNLFVGEDKIIAWLESRSPQAVLLLDEANLEDPGKWGFLRGLTENKITYKNKTYPLGPQHKVVFTGNPSDYPGRHLHSVIWEKSHVIWFAPFQLHFIKTKIGEFLKGRDSKDLDAISETICKGYQFLGDHTHRITEITMRDIENICARYQTTKQPIPDVMFEEMRGVLATDKDRQEFKHYLQSISSHSIPERKLEHAPKKLTIPSDLYDAWETLLDDLVMREERVKAGSNVLPGRTGSNKLGTLLEGPSGIGKTTLLIGALEHLGYTEDAKEAQKKYYQITTGSQNVSETLLKAFHEGSIVILDELNLDPDVEKLLNQLLSGFTPDNQPAKKAGFTVLSTQNPPKYTDDAKMISMFAGTKKTSTALLSRFHVVPMKDISYESFEAFARDLKYPEPRKLTLAYKDLRSKDPSINARSMFGAIKRQQPVAPEIESTPKPLPRKE